jgi:hypothetical protein
MAFDARRSAVANLRGEFGDKQRLYKNRVGPIRHKVFAHDAKITKAEKKRLFVELPLRDLEELIVYPLRLHRALWMLYNEGHEPILSDAPWNIGNVMKNFPEKRTLSWEHLHAAKDAAAFLRWMRAFPLDE